MALRCGQEDVLPRVRSGPKPEEASMKRFCTTLTSLLAVGTAAFAQTHTTDQILQVARATWPGPHTVGIICDYSDNRSTIEAMLGSFPQGSTIHVIDTKAGVGIARACTYIGNRHPQYVLLLPEDRLVYDGSFHATQVISNMNRRQIPTLGTTPLALSQGAWAVMGPATGNLLQVNPSLNGYVETYGTPISPLHPIANNSGSQAKTSLSVIAAY